MADHSPKKGETLAEQLELIHWLEKRLVELETEVTAIKADLAHLRMRTT